jgi:hypothetical protein
MDKTKTHHGHSVKDWLIKPVTIGEAEEEHKIPEEWVAKYGCPTDSNNCPLPFGYMNGKWVEMKSHMQEGDVLWTFDSPLKYWQALAGAEGIALVRNGEVIEILMTSMN